MTSKSSKSFLPKLFYSFSLKKRIWFTFVLLITLGLASAGSIAYLIAAKEIQRNAFQSSQDTVNQSSQIVNERLKNIGIAVRSLMFSDAFEEVMDDVQKGDKSRYYNLLTLLQPVFSQVKFNDSMIDSILIASPIGNYYHTSNVLNPSGSFYNSDLFEHFKQLKRGFWTKGHKDEFFTDHQRVISLIVEGVFNTSDRVLPSNTFVIVNVKEDALRDLFMQNLSQSDKNYYFIDSTGEEIQLSERGNDKRMTKQPEFLAQLSADMTGSFFYGTSGKDYLVNYSRLDVKDDWIIVGVQSKSELLYRLNGIKMATSYVIIGFILLSLFIANNLTYVLLKPLFRLQKLMKRVEENDLTVRFESEYKDEVSQVGFRFNRMLDEIGQLIEDVKSREREKRKAEIKALTAQMDPHFFYNTLNTIYCKSVLGESDDVNEMILGLSQMFQLSLSGGRDLISLHDELDHVNQYLAIQMKSYEGLFECHINADPELMNCLVPKIIIQPLVENTILHGFHDRTEGGEIRIIAEADKEWIHLTVEDNGSGLEPERLRVDLVHSTTHNEGYALRNIYHRLQLYFGEEQRMLIGNTESGGARIELWIPMQVETEGENTNEQMG